MTELSLFTGAGGGVLGSKILGWRTLGYVEIEPYCQKILKQRISDGILDAAPIFGDIRKFISEGYAESYKGLVDVVAAGFPCQPFSVAGKRKGEADERNMWPSTIAVIRAIRPRFAFLENVPGLLSSGYFGRILGDLAEAGYDAEWGVLGASDIGANHRRKRLWILAYAESGIRQWTASRSTGHTSFCRKNVADSEVAGQQGGIKRQGEVQSWGRNPRAGKCKRTWWSVEPRVGRVVTGFPFRVDRLKALGNAQVPIQMAVAYAILSQGVDG